MSLSQLPDGVLEDLLSLISYSDVSRVRAVSRHFYACCTAVLSRGFVRFQKELLDELSSLHQQLSSLVPGADCLDSPEELAQRRSPLQRSHNLLELLLSEFRLLRAAAATHAQLRTRCFPGGHLLDSFYSLLKKAKGYNLPPWSMDTDLTCQLLCQIKRYLSAYQLSPYYTSSPVGVLCCDILDALVEADISVTATLDGDNHVCHLSAEYQLVAAKVLWPALLETGPDGTITFEQARRLAEYLFNVVRFNNRVALRQEQYCREIDLALLTRGITDVAGVEPSNRCGRLWLPPRDYPEKRQCTVLTAEDAGGDVIGGRFFVVSTQDGPLLSTVDSAGALSCRLRFTCPLSSVPLQLRSDTSKALASLEELEQWLSEPDPQSSQKFVPGPSEDTLDLCLQLEVVSSGDLASFQYKYTGSSVTD